MLAARFTIATMLIMTFAALTLVQTNGPARAAAAAAATLVETSTVGEWVARGVTNGSMLTVSYDITEHVSLVGVKESVYFANWTCRH